MDLFILSYLCFPLLSALLDYKKCGGKGVPPVAADSNFYCHSLLFGNCIYMTIGSTLLTSNL